MLLQLNEANFLLILAAAGNERVDIMGDELPSLSNDGRIAIEKRGHIFLIVIDRPKKSNGFSVKMLELRRAFSMMEDDTDIRCGVHCRARTQSSRQTLSGGSIVLRKRS
jgi:hypothetical protein